MEKNKTDSDMKSTMEKSLGFISVHRHLSRLAFILILMLYFFSIFLVAKSANSRGVIVLFRKGIPVALFTGVFSSLSNICIILLVVLIKKIGFFTALTIISFQFVNLLCQLIAHKNISTLPGIFSNIVALVAILILYINDRRLERYQDRIQKQAVTDAVTGLPNRFACTELMDYLVKSALNFTVVSVGLNNFKNINDMMGYGVGNKVLQQISRRWEKLADLRKSITVDFIAHISGGEFCLIIRGYENANVLIEAINAYRQELEKPVTVENCDYFLTSSFGYAEYPLDANNGIDLLSGADAAMHELKRVGSNGSIKHFTKELVESSHSLEIERKIRSALDNDEILFYLQPQYDLSHKLRGFEALARMKDKDGKLVSPGEFIPVAEKIGLIDRIDMSVFSKTAKFLKAVLEKKSVDITISFNISVRHLMKNGFIEEIKSILDTCGVPAKFFEIEITESIMIDSVEKALQCVNEIKKMGIKLAIDDFGTGYSSLSYLNKFPADLLKVDKSFIDVMNSSDSSKKYVASIISIGHVLNFEVISEGVETPDQLETLQKIGCNYIQGFIWGKPMPPEEAEKIIFNYA